MLNITALPIVKIELKPSDKHARRRFYRPEAIRLTARNRAALTRYRAFETKAAGGDLRRLIVMS
jgi:hypothetical protein